MTGAAVTMTTMTEHEAREWRAAEAGEREPATIKAEYVIERDGKRFVLYAGLLDAAHERGLKAITTTLVQIPNELNDHVAIVHATVETAQGTFTGLGDAAPFNLTRMMQPHAIRMAETRAKARALRDAVNVAEALADDGAAHGENGPADGEDDEIGEQQAPRVRLGAAAPQRVWRDAGDERALEGAAVRRAAVDRRNADVPAQDDQDDGFGGYDTAPAPRGAYPTSGAGSGGTAGPAASGPAATPKQLETIARMARAAKVSINTDGFTKDQASEVIQRLIAGMPKSG